MYVRIRMNNMVIVSRVAAPHVEYRMRGVAPSPSKAPLTTATGASSARHGKYHYDVTDRTVGVYAPIRTHADHRADAHEEPCGLLDDEGAIQRRPTIRPVHRKRRLDVHT